MRILVTGAGGFLGSRLVAHLLAYGYTGVRCLLRDRMKMERLQPLVPAYPNARLDFIFGNLKSAQVAAQAVDGVDLIFHLASAMKGSTADMFLDSVVASKNLLDAVTPNARAIRIVLISSFGVYGVAGLPRGAVVNEHTPLEKHPEWRDPYSHCKLRQEQLFWEYRDRFGFQLVVLRPGVIYGPGGPQMSSRVGLNVFGVFLHLGGNNLLPLTYVDNCAEAAVLAAARDEADGQVFNVHDDDLPTSSQYLRSYKRHVRNLRSIRVPYPAMIALSNAVQWYHRWSKGQLPQVFTPYKTKTTWGGNRFDNAKLKSIGWKQAVPTTEGMRLALASFRQQARFS
jgi:nucleoside-diphosphate-sugar epimerase